MTTVQRVAQIFGVVFILLALLGFFQGMSMESSLLLGLFPVNLLHNIVHLLFGLWGLAASRTFAAAKTYAQVGGVVYLLLAVFGFVDPSGFGLVPLGGNDVWLHAVIGLVLAGVGFTAKDTAVAPKAA
ncbi:MAG TPA: DUF4383 domain-containing protein [Gemmatimonadaceae bacterium]|jgi:hypothetical protein|nr:DUF4383 domain-containing protein [Gemmatimonadaceae bacterium]